MTPEIAAASNLQSVITRAIGADQLVQPDLFDGAAEPGDVLLLASDGFTRYATPELISRIVAEDADTQATCGRVIQHAKDSGGVDNITCLLIRVASIDSMTAEADSLAPPRFI
jgi:protein phosphatase